MSHKFRSIWLVVLLTAVFITTTQIVSPQEAPPPPPHNREELERLPGVESGQNEQIAAADVTTIILPWSKRTFQSYRDGNWEIYTSYDDGSGEARLTAHGAVDMHPRLNRGATRIVFTSKRDGAYEIYTMNVDGSGVTRLTFTGSDNVYPAWSPDGSKIAFQSYREGQSEIYVMNANGSGLTRLTAELGYDGYPAWSPDGTKIAFNSSRSGQLYIYVMNANGSGVTQLSNQIYSYNPVWSPDGTKIAYDADTDNDGWQELWTMDANGANQQNRYNPYGQVDTWAHSWSPDGRYIAYTLTNFTYYQGNWYWVDAYLDAFDTQQNTTARLSSSGLDWNPDWQTTDALKPTVAMNSLPSTSPGPLAVRWSGGDAGGSGLKNFDVQVKVGSGGDWVNWLSNSTQTSASYPAIGGQSYAFRIRARDKAFNVSAWSPTTTTTVEALAPETAVSPLPPFTRADTGGLIASWSGGDPGGSGIDSYDVQYRLNNESWVDWLTKTNLSSANLAFNGQPGDVIGIRSRARDRAQNLEAWPPAADTTTTLYRWGITGQIHDNTGTPIGAASIQTSPSSLNEALSNSEGDFGSYIAAASAVYSATLSKDGYGTLPLTSYPLGSDADVQIALPPTYNSIGNGNFEDDFLTDDWIINGNETPIVISSTRHTGQQSVQFGTTQLFSEPQAVSEIVSSFGFQSAMGNDDTIHAVWIKDNHWAYSQSQSNGSWSLPYQLPSDADCQLQYDDPYEMKVQASGVVQLAWVATNNYSRHDDDWLCYLERTPAGVWKPLEKHYFNEFPGQGTNSRQIILKIASDGVVHVTWMHISDDYKWRLFYAKRGANGVWSNNETIAESLDDDYFKTWLYTPELAIEPNGTVHFVWMQRETTDPRGTNLFYRYKAPNGQWSSTEQITFYPTQFNAPEFTLSLNVDAYGVLHLVYELESSANLGPILYMHRISGQWSPIIELGIHGNFDEVQTSLDPLGNMHIAWTMEGLVHYARKNRLSSSFTEVTLGELVSNVMFHADAVGQAHFLLSDWTGDKGVFVMETNGNQFVQKTLPDLRYLSFELNSVGAPYFLGLDMIQYSNLLSIEPARVQQDRESAISQTISIPADMETPILSFFYLYNGLIGDESNSFDVLLDDGQVSTLWQQSQVDERWRHQWFDLTPWKGETVTLTFQLHQEQQALNTWAFLDSVTVGSANPDVWVTAGRVHGLPNEQIEHTLTYGNRGGAVAAGTRLTYTLPAELSFVSASLPPISTSPLVWDLGDLSAKSEPMTLSVVVQVAPTAVPFTTLSSMAVLSAISTELELLNNSARGETLVSHQVYLPVIHK